MIKPGQLEIDNTNVQSLSQAEPPTNKTQLRSFLGLRNFYHHFMDDFTRIAHLLNKLLRKGSQDTFQLEAEQHDVLKALINKVCSQPVLALIKANLLSLATRYFKLIRVANENRLGFGPDLYCQQKKTTPHRIKNPSQ